MTARRKCRGIPFSSTDWAEIAAGAAAAGLPATAFLRQAALLAAHRAQHGKPLPRVEITPGGRKSRGIPFSSTEWAAIAQGATLSHMPGAVFLRQAGIQAARRGV